MESLRRCASSETADRVARADEAMGRSGPESRRQMWRPCLQHRLPGRSRQLTVEEGDPVGAAALVAQGRLPVLRRERVARLWAVLEAIFIPFNPGEHRVGAVQDKEGLGGHRAMIGVSADQIWASTM